MIGRSEGRIWAAWALIWLLAPLALLSGCGSGGAGGGLAGPVPEGGTPDTGPQAQPSPLPFPDGSWSRIGSAGETFDLSAVRQLRFGSGSDWIYRQDSGKVTCSNQYFGYWGDVRIVECQVFTPAVANTVATTVPGGGPLVDVSKVPRGSAGHSEELVRYTGEMPAVPDDGTGSFRDGCDYSHMAFDDPLVKPGQPGQSHLHVFFGNTQANAFSTASSLATTGNSSCNGGTINRTSYWVPAVIDTLDGTPIAPTFATFYYKTGYNGIKPSEIRALPDGLRMIAGDPKNRSPGGNFNFTCENGGPNVPKPAGSIVNCPVGSQLWMNISFPQCWDGTNLDSPDHKSHMSFTVKGACPASHPVPIPEISYHIVYLIKQANAPLRWRLSSDAYDPALPAGYSMHADWFNGWKREFMETWLQYCNQAARDCHSHLLGDGREFYGS